VSELTEPSWLPEFPVDDEMLDRVEHALGTCWTYDYDGTRVHHGGDYTLPELLDFMSGYDPALAIPTGTAPGPFGDDVEWTEYPFPTYHEHDVIRALVAEVRRLREGVECDGPQSCECRCHDEADRCPRCDVPPGEGRA
jgi:hypothetical protein